MDRTRLSAGHFIAAILGCLVVALLYWTSQYSYLLFHSLVELFGIAIAGGIFILAWNSRHFHGNNYLLIIGTGSLFAAVFALMHTLTYKGMGVLPDSDANLATQLWIASRYCTALTFVAAPLLASRRVNATRLLLIYAVASALTLGSIFAWHIFPICYVEGSGLTPFKIVSEFVISVLFLTGAALLYLQQARFDRHVFRLLLGSIVTAVACELAFTQYDGVFDLANFVGHLLVILSYYLIYRAIIETGLRQPYALLFRDLKQAHDDLDQRVQERTAQLTEANLALAQHAERLEILRRIDRAILAAQSPAEIAQAAVEHILRAMDCCRVSVLLFEPGATSATLLAVAGEHDSALQPGQLIPLAALKLLDDNSRTALANLAELAASPALSDIASPLLAEGARFCMSIPLSPDDHTIGTLYLWTGSESGLSEESRNFASQVADSLAVAIANARLFEQLAASRQQLQRLSHSLVEAQENQARQIGRDLHDDAGQALTALKLGLGQIAHDAACTPALASRLLELREATDELMERLHSLSVSLRPVSLDRLGLAVAVKQYGETVRRQRGIEVETIALGLEGERLPADVETNLYRVVQEAVTNITRHARATRAGVILERRADAVIAIIEDDGVGFDPDAAAARGRLGLVGMRERVEMLGGHLEIESQPGSGTTVFAEIPCPVAAPAVLDDSPVPGDR